jgi:lipoate-protein ligase B
MISDLGLIDYEDALRIQKEWVARRRLQEIEDSCLIAEHPAVFTIGRAGSLDHVLTPEDILRNAGIRVIPVDRGGDVTFHGPGQLVIYPIIDLSRKVMDLHRHLRDLEEVAIRLLGEYSVAGSRIAGKTGVWVDGAKISSAGIAARNWITYHGLSINVNVDLSFFSMIYPCGMKDVKVTSLKAILKREVSMSEAKARTARHIEDIFGVRQEAYARTS